MKRQPHTRSPPKRQRTRPPPLDAHLWYWLRRAASEVSHALSVEVEDKGVTLAEWIVLRELYDGDRRPSALAERLGLTRGAISKLAERLVEDLLITQEADSADGRGQMLVLTDLGRTVVTVLAPLADAIDKKFFEHLDEGARAALTSTLREIIRRRDLRAAPAD